MATVSVRYIVDDVAAAIEFSCGRLGVAEQMHRVGGKQILAEDPSGNPVELFQPTIGGAK